MLEPIFEVPTGSDRSERSVNAGGPMIAGLAGGVTVPTCASPPKADELEGFRVQRREIHAHLAGKLGLTLLSGSFSGRRLVVVQDFHRSARCTAEDGSTVVYGASARLVVDIAGFEGSAQLTLPAIAAQVEMGVASAQYDLSARGYVGKVGDLLGAPSALDVENYVKLIDSITKLQQLIADDYANIRPVPLFLELPDATDGDAERRWAVGTTFGLSQLADGRSLNQAKKDIEWDSWSPEAQEAIASIYTEATGQTDPDLRPNDASKASALAFIGRLRLRA